MSYRVKLLNYFRQRNRGWVLLLFAAVCIVYLPFIGSPFVFDDLNFFSGNMPDVYARSLFQFNLRGLPYASLGWTTAIFSDVQPHFFRLGNMLLHIANVILLFFLLRQLAGAVIADNENSSAVTWGAWLGALFFACHPVAVYAVGYVIQRSILMATLFALVMQLAYVRGLLTGQKRWLALAVGFYFLACFSKEHSVMMPAVLGAMTILLREGGGEAAGLTERSASLRADTASVPLGYPAAVQTPSSRRLETDLPVLCAPLRGLRGRNRVTHPALWATWCAFAVIGIFVVLRAKGVFGVPYEVMAAALFEQQDIVENTPMLHLLSTLTQAWLFFKYLLLWWLPNPAWMSVDMREHFISSWFAWQGWMGVIGFIGYGILGGWLLLRSRWMGLAGLALLYPWLQFMVEFTSIRVQEPFVLYRSYLWLPGMMLFFPLLLVKLAERGFLGRRTLLGLGLLVLLLVPLAWNRLWVFTDNYRLWNDAAQLLHSEQEPGADRIFYNRGNAELVAQNWEDAIADFQRAVALSPQLAPLHHALGLAYMNTERYQDALVQFDAAIALKPDDARFYYAKGMSLKRLHKDGLAMQQIEKSCQLKYIVACLIVQMRPGKK